MTKQELEQKVNVLQNYITEYMPKAIIAESLYREIKDSSLAYDASTLNNFCEEMYKLQNNG